MSEAKGGLTLEEIESGLAELARTGEGAQRTQAYRLLLGLSGSSVTLPEPLNETECIDRLARMMRSQGRDRVQKAWRKAWPTGVMAIETVHKQDDFELDDDDRALVEKVQGLKTLYRFFPEIRRSGFPPGYPQRRGKAVQKVWAQGEAIKILIDRKRLQFSTPPKAIGTDADRPQEVATSRTDAPVVGTGD